MRKLARICLAIAAVVACAAATASLAVGDAGEVATGPAAGSGWTGSADAPGLGAFARGREANDALPAVAAAEVSARPQRPDVGKAVKAAELGDRSLYLVPARTSVCLALVERELGAAVSCDDAGAVDNGGVRPAYVLTNCSGPPPPQGPPQCTGIVLYGVVADGVAQVTVERDGSGSDEIPVTDNAYLYEGPAAGVRAVRYVLATGREIRVDVPL